MEKLGLIFIRTQNNVLIHLFFEVNLTITVLWFIDDFMGSLILSLQFFINLETITFLLAC